MIIGKLFNKEIDLPDKKLIIVTGKNNSGKTELLKYLNNYFLSKGNNVLYFPTDRKLDFSKEEIDSLNVMHKLKTGGNLLYDIENCFDISDPFAFETTKPGDIISSGYLQLINLFFNLIKQDKKNIILLIDNFELNLHPLTMKHLVKILMDMDKIDKIILTTYMWIYSYPHECEYPIEIILK